MQESSISMPSTSTSPRSSLTVKNEASQSQDQSRLIQGRIHFTEICPIKVSIKTIILISQPYIHAR